MEDTSYEYTYVVEWDDSVHHPPYTVMHRIKLNPGIDREAFEKFMVEQGFQNAGNVNTRAGGVIAQYLLIDTTGDPPKRFEELDFRLEPFGQDASVKKFRVVGGWRRKTDISSVKEVSDVQFSGKIP